MLSYFTLFKLIEERLWMSHSLAGIEELRTAVLTNTFVIISFIHPMLILLLINGVLSIIVNINCIFNDYSCLWGVIHQRRPTNNWLFYLPPLLSNFVRLKDTPPFHVRLAYLAYHVGKTSETQNLRIANLRSIFLPHEALCIVSIVRVSPILQKWTSYLYLCPTPPRSWSSTLVGPPPSPIWPDVFDEWPLVANTFVNTFFDYCSVLTPNRIWF